MTIRLYVPVGIRRTPLSSWYIVQKWPHGCPRHNDHVIFLILDDGRTYRAGAIIDDRTRAQVAALVMHCYTQIGSGRHV